MRCSTVLAAVLLLPVNVSGQAVTDAVNAAIVVTANH